MEEYYPCPKMNFRQRCANFWYYHKWLVITILFFLAFIAIATVQFFQKDDADVSLLYVGPALVDDRLSRDLIESSSPLVDDENGDGKALVDFININLSGDINLLSGGKLIEAREEYQRYCDEILSGEACILLLDEYYYLELAQTGSLVNLYEIFDEDELSSSLFDGFGLRLKNTPLYRLPGYRDLPENTVLCLKYASAVVYPDWEERIEADENNLEVFRLFYERAKSQ